MTPRRIAETEGPKVRIGDRIRLRRSLYWILPEGRRLTVPEGTVGEVFPWETPEWGRGIAFKFEGFDHPVTRYFPMVLLEPGRSGYPQHIEPLPRAGEGLSA
jgi:hypothetical protein